MIPPPVVALVADVAMDRDGAALLRGNLNGIARARQLWAAQCGGMPPTCAPLRMANTRVRDSRALAGCARACCLGNVLGEWIVRAPPMVLSERTQGHR